jgi:hypothetical protein
MSNTDTEQELDAAVLAKDQVREAYVLKRLRTRRRMAIIAFAQFIVGGAGLIFAGLFMPGKAELIDHMGAFLSLYFSGLSASVIAYWGLGAMSGSSYSGFGGYGMGQSNYGGMSSYGGYNSGGLSQQTPISHPPLVKHPTTVSVPPQV